MNVGIYFDLLNPPTSQRSWAHVYGFALEMCEEAERLGCHSVWATEHHLFDDGYLTQPLGFSPQLPRRTTSIRLGTAIVIAPLHHPVDIAEHTGGARRHFVERPIRPWTRGRLSRPRVRVVRC